jgi:hypothetical protein
MNNTIFALRARLLHLYFFFLRKVKHRKNHHSEDLKNAKWKKLEKNVDFVIRSATRQDPPNS